MLVSYRHSILCRDGYQCQRCGAREDLCAHHIKYRRDGGPDTPETLVTLCSLCHAKLHHGEGWDALARHNALRAIKLKQAELLELYDRFIAALYGQGNLPCDLWYGELVIFL